MSSRARAAAGSAVFFLLAPGIVAGVVPWWITRWQMRPPFLAQEWTRWVGAPLALAGLVVVLDAFARFAREGLGTPAPVAPTERLVVSGPYRRTRNPMYLGVSSMILGQALLLASTALLLYAAAVATFFHLFVVFYEEPTLAERYGAEYERYRRAVPRWSVRPRAWRGPGPAPPATR